MPSKRSQKEYPSAGVPGDGGGKVGSPSLCGGLWGGHGILLTQELGGHFCTPIHLLTSGMPLAALLGMLATAQLWVVEDEEPVPTAPIPKVPETPAPPTGTKCWCHSLALDVPALRQEEEETVVPNYTPEEHPCQKRKEGRLPAKALKEPHCETFSKE